MNQQPCVELVLGGTRSGKSRFAEQRSEELAKTHAKPLYIATAELFDEEMRQRVRLHQQRRSASWATVEVPLALAPAVRTHSCAGSVLLVDCLSVWLGNLLHHDKDVDAHTQDLIECLPALPGPVVMVASEVGLGIVPETPLVRAYRDHAGQLNQAVAAICTRVTLVVAGQPLVIKGG